jgi:uncharacterized metal-binding protein
MMIFLVCFLCVDTVQNASHDSVTCPSLILERTAMKKDIVMQLHVARALTTGMWGLAVGVMLHQLLDAVTSETHHFRGRSN